MLRQITGSPHFVRFWFFPRPRTKWNSHNVKQICAFIGTLMEHFLESRLKWIQWNIPIPFGFCYLDEDTLYHFALTTSKNPSCHKKLNKYCLNHQHKVRKWGKISTMWNFLGKIQTSHKVWNAQSETAQSEGYLYMPNW